MTTLQNASSTVPTALTNSVSLKGHWAPQTQIDSPSQKEKVARSGAIGEATTERVPSKKKTFSLLALGLGVGLGVGFLVQTWVSPGMMEAAEDLKAQQRIAVMKAEQQVLVSQHLAPSRYIGVVGLRHGSQGELGQGDMMTDRATFKGYRVGEVGYVLDDVLSRLTGHSLLDKENAISPQTQKIAPDPYSILTDAALVYRHEEGHAQMSEEHIQVKSPSAWSGNLSRIVVQRLNQHDDLVGPGKTERAEMKRAGLSVKSNPVLLSADQLDLRNWRENWMASLRGEAFADAFAVLTQAHRGDAALKETALKIHSNRLVGTGKQMGPNVLGGAIFAAGSNHAVDMASFLAGQMKAESITKLTRMEVLELSGRIADASLAWSVARQGPLIGFFASEGQTWALKAGMKAGLSEPQALKEWNAWKKEASSDTPDAAFGVFKWNVGGHEFNAKGLMKHESPNIQWRFDGSSGVRGGKFIERGAGGPVATHQMLDLEDKKADMFEAAGMLDARQDAIQSSKSGPLWTQWVMAKRLGTDPKKELERFKGSFGEDQGQELFGYSEDLFKGIESTMSFTSEALSEQVSPLKSEGGLNMKRKLQEHREQKKSLEVPKHQESLSFKSTLYKP